MIDQITVERILGAAQILDVVSDFVTLKRAGVNFKGLCPFHDERTPSFIVSPSKNICKCFSCGEGGSPVHFIMKHEQLSYGEALKYLARKYGIEVKEHELTDEEKARQDARESMFILNDFARDLFVKTLHDTIEGQSVGLSYLRERGFRDDTIKKFQIGYGLEKRDAFSTEALKAGFKPEFLLKTGLCMGNEDGSAMNDRFRERVIFPIHSISGKVVAFGGRILRKADRLAKYVNSPESEIYSKSNELYGIYYAKQAIIRAERCFLVEGYTDVISMHQAGIENVVASSGTALTHGQIRLIQRFSPNITVLYDGDAAGIKAALRGIDLLLEAGMNVKVVLLPDGEDPDSFARKQNAEQFHKFIEDNETDFIRFKTQLLLNEVADDPIKRAGLVSNIVESIAVIPDNILRSVYVQDCAALLGLSEAMLNNEVKKIRLKKQEQGHPQGRSRSKSQTNTNTSEPTQKDETPETAKDDKNPFDIYEREVIRYVIRYGNKPIYERYRKEKATINGKMEEIDVLDERGPSVIEFVKFDFERDEITFSVALYKAVFDESCAKMHDENFDPSRYFLMHHDQEINKLASDLLSDRYTLSKLHSRLIGEEIDSKNSRLIEQNLLETLVPRATTELKNCHVMQQIKEVKKQLKLAIGDEQMEVMRRLHELQEVKKLLAKALGERIVLKYN